MLNRLISNLDKLIFGGYEFCEYSTLNEKNKEKLILPHEDCQECIDTSFCLVKEILNHPSKKSSMAYSEILMNPDSTNHETQEAFTKLFGPIN